MSKNNYVLKVNKKDTKNILVMVNKKLKFEHFALNTAAQIVTLYQ